MMEDEEENNDLGSVEVIYAQGDEDDVNVDDEESDEEGAGAPEDMAVVTFRGHTEKPHADDEPPEVYAVSIDPSGSGLAVTGGRDDTAYVWVMNQGQVVFECKGHNNSVTCVAFSHDGMFVASADLDGLIKVWRCQSKAEVWFYECGADITWLQWHHSAHVLLAGTQSGEVWMWQVPSQDWTKVKTFQSHGHPALCGTISADGKSVCVGYGDGVVKVWDLKTAKNLHTWQHATMPEDVDDEMEGDSEEEGKEEGGGEGAEGEEKEEEEGPATSPVAILSVDFSKDNSLVISGCADSTAKVFNTFSGKMVSCFNCATSEDKDNSVESVSFCPQAPYAATATNSGTVEIWDLPTSVCRHKLQHPEGVSKIKWSKDNLHLYAACLDGTLHVWDARQGSSLAVLTGHTPDSCILDFDVTGDGTCLVSASEDGTARVFDLRFTKS